MSSRTLEGLSYEGLAKMPKHQTFTGVQLILHCTRSLGPRRPNRARAQQAARPQCEPLEARALLATTSFGGSIQFTRLPQWRPLLGVAQPVVPLGPLAHYADLRNSSGGVTIELWVRPSTSGALVEQPYQAQLSAPNLGAAQNLGTNFEVPLIWIDNQGKVEAGLIDTSGGPISVQTQFATTTFAYINRTIPTITLTTPLGLRTSSDQPYSTGVNNPIVGLNSLLNDGWHHVALVATPTSESLYVDGQLQGIHAGSFGLTFNADFGGTPGVASPSGDARLGGTMIPEPAKSTAFTSDFVDQSRVRNYLEPQLYPDINYPYGYSGNIDELRVWDLARSASQIQGSIDTPLEIGSTDATHDLKIADHFNGAPADIPGIRSGFFPVPVDLFPGVARLPGYRPFGLKIATPFDTVQLNADVSRGAPFVRKVGLARGDQIVVSATGQDGNPISSGTFTLSVNTSPNESSDRQRSTVAFNPFHPAPITFTAGETGTYRLTATFANLPAGVNNVTITYKVVPGPSNGLLDLFGYFKAADGSYVPAYHDPGLPEVSSIDANGFLNRANWPLLTTIVPPAGVNQSSESDLMAAYTAIYNAPLPSGGTLATKYTLTGGFYDIVGSSLINSDDLARFAIDLNSIQFGDLSGVTPNAFATMKSFLLLVTELRTKALGVLDSYKAFASNLLTTGALQDIPGSVVRTVIASLMQNNTNQKPPTLSWPNSADPGFDVGQAFQDTALGLVPGVAGTIASTLLPGSGFLVEGLASVGLAALTYSTSPEPPTPSLITSIDANDYANINNVASSVQADLATTGGNLVASFNSPTLRQVVMSNYGLLNLLMSVPSSPFSQADFAQSSRALQTALANATWKQIVAAAYHWQPDVPTTTDHSALPIYTATGAPYELFVHRTGQGLQIPSRNSGLSGMLYELQGGNTVTTSNPESVGTSGISASWSPSAPAVTLNQSTNQYFTTGLFSAGYYPPIPPNFVQVPVNSQTQGSGARFYTLAATNLTETSQHDYTSNNPPYQSTRTLTYQRDGVVGVNWILEDSNGLEMSPAISQQLFGVGSTPVNLVSTGLPQYSNGGVYFPVNPVPGAVTSWPDAFLNWGIPTPGSVPGSLVPTGPIQGTFASPNGPRGDARNSSSGSADVNYTFTFRPVRPYRPA